MATLEFCDKHNMVSYLEKPEGSAEFHQIIDFLTTSHIHYALTENPTIYASFINQFWTTATISTNVHGEVKLTASIDGQAKTITEASLRRHLKLEDDGGITSLPNTEIFEQLALMGYATDSDKLTFQKGNFSPQWRFFIHTILHCLSPKKTSWEQFSSNIATAIICLSTNRTFNFSKFIFDAMNEPTELIEDQGSGEKGEQDVTTADIALNTTSVPFSTAIATPKVSTAAESLVYIRRSAKKKKDKGKAIIDKEERKRIARDAEIAKQLQEEYDKVGKKEAVTEVDIAHVIDWDDPAVIRYHALQNRPKSVAEVRKNMMVYLKNQRGYKMKYFKGMSYDDIIPIFEKVWDQIHSFVPMDSEEEVQRLKRAGQMLKETLSMSELQNCIFSTLLSGSRTRDDIFTLNHAPLHAYLYKEIELWVELKMLFELNAENLLELQKYMHDPLKWWLYDMCAVHHVSTEKGQDIFMLVKKDYPLTKGLTTLMLSNKLRVDQQSEMTDDLLTKIYNIANKSRK
ncbi:hypothetical protein Tco_0416987 [Tanacetum coccineum]